MEHTVSMCHKSVIEATRSIFLYIMSNFKVKFRLPGSCLLLTVSDTPSVPNYLQLECLFKSWFGISTKIGITGPLCGESTGDLIGGFPHTKDKVMTSSCTNARRRWVQRQGL